MWSPADWSCPASGCDCVTGAASRMSTVYRFSYLLYCSSWSSRWPEEEERWKQTPLLDSSLHLKAFRQLIGMGNSAVHVLKGAPDEGDYLLWDSIVSQQLPHCLSVYTVKGLLIICEVDLEGWVPLQWLFHDNAQAHDLVGTGSVPPKACLLISELGVNSLLHPLQ